MGVSRSHFTSDGFCDWKHSNRLVVHEQSKDHIQAVLSAASLSKGAGDSTPDEGHIDELTLIIRYLEHDTPVERFVKFLPNQGHKAQEMFEGLMKFLADNDIDIQNGRGQSYDNATSMSGRYNASTHRYAILSDLLKTVASGPVSVPKRIFTTRWSCQAVAVKTVVQGYPPIREALAKIARCENETSKTCYEANGLHDKMCKLETAIYAVFWHDILGRVDATSHALQDPKLDLNTAVAMLKSLECFVREKRDCFHVYEKKGREMSETGDYSQTRKHQRNVRLNSLDYGRSEEAALSQSEKFRAQNFLPAIYQFLSSLDQRLKAYEETCSLFGFLSKLESMNCDEIEAAAAKLVAEFKNDLDQALGVELVQLTAFFTQFFEDEDDEKGRAHYLYKLLIDKKVVDTFPNVEIMLRMYLVLMVTNCSGESSFSKMKFIKNRLRTTMCHDRLSHLALMSIEYDILREIDFEKLIKNFAAARSRKVPGL
ncbi:uncharacterized protein LOC121867057 [Homarus americanus]|uniref:uncharacterized protein LOC121867057 n=1 Tax=Homarus americanus TaxID=6706 RepID=UPI001C44DB4C|nr:uncharacterized protein LOC121867057 [Homarus americanus]